MGYGDTLVSNRCHFLGSGGGSLNLAFYGTKFFCTQHGRIHDLGAGEYSDIHVSARAWWETPTNRKGVWGSTGVWGGFAPTFQLLHF